MPDLAGIRLSRTEVNAILSWQGRQLHRSPRLHFGVSSQVQVQVGQIEAQRLHRAVERLHQVGQRSLYQAISIDWDPAICRELTELMGGTIRAESVVGVGTPFSLTLPLKEPQAEVRGAA